MSHQDAALRRLACTAALRCVLDDSVIEQALRELEERFQCLSAEEFPGVGGVQSAEFQKVLRDWGRGHLLTEFALHRLSRALMQALHEHLRHHARQLGVVGVTA